MGATVQSFSRMARGLRQKVRHLAGVDSAAAELSGAPAIPGGGFEPARPAGSGRDVASEGENFGFDFIAEGCRSWS